MIGPSVTGNAVIQHMAKLRKKVEERERNGRALVTPQKSGFSSGPKKSRAKTANFTKSSDDVDIKDFDLDKADPDEDFGESIAKRKAKRVKARKTYKNEATDEETTDKVKKSKRTQSVSQADANTENEKDATPLKKAKMEKTSDDMQTPTKRGKGVGGIKMEAKSDEEEEDPGEQYVARYSKFLTHDPKERERQLRRALAAQEKKKKGKSEFRLLGSRASMLFNDLLLGE